MYTCSYCTNVFEKKDLTIDHIIPKSKGGKTSWDNVTTSCKSCNISKADKIVFKFHFFLNSSIVLSKKPPQ